MSDKFQDKYRIPSARAIWWDYRDDAAYFVTICTAFHECYFGKISDEIMTLSEMGEIAQQNWMDIPVHFPFIRLDAFVVMPNHVHGILVLDKNPRRSAINRDSKNSTYTGKNEIDCNSEKANLNFADSIHPVKGSEHFVEGDAINHVSTDKIGGATGENNSMLSENLSRVIRWFKGRTTFDCRSIHAGFAWQTRFYDHIIRNEESYQNIREYILTNPARWTKDKYNTLQS